MTVSKTTYMRRSKRNPFDSREQVNGNQTQYNCLLFFEGAHPIFLLFLIIQFFYLFSYKYQSSIGKAVYFSFGSLAQSSNPGVQNQYFFANIRVSGGMLSIFLLDRQLRAVTLG